MRRVLLALAIGIAIMAASGWYLRPRITASGDYKFLYCEKCQFEIVYSKSLAGGRCPHCKPPEIGKLMPAKKSIHEGGEKPWRQFNIALSFEGICLLGVIVFLLYLPPKRAGKAGYLVTNCPNCRRKLRFPAERAGQSAGWCPACKAMFVYPTLAELSDF